MGSRLRSGFRARVWHRLGLEGLGSVDFSTTGTSELAKFSYAHILASSTSTVHSDDKPASRCNSEAQPPPVRHASPPQPMRIQPQSPPMQPQPPPVSWPH